jgi:pimeloyl-ACP methyl ester carboxylesterase
MDENHDARLMTTEWGRGDASNVALLVHGLTGRAGAFETLVEGLDPEGSVPGGGWRFLAPDLRGRGASREITSGEGGIPEHARDLLALLDREGLERVVFVGHSLGAMIGVYIAAEHPERLSGLVLVDGGADVTDEVYELTLPAVERLGRSYPSREAYVEHVKGFPFFEGRWDEHLERYFAGDVYRGGGEWRPLADPGSARRDQEKLPGFSLNERHPKIRCPTLVLLSTVGLLGLDEGYILPPEEARRMHRVIPDCNLVEVEDTNHYDVLYSAPKTTVEAARAFLARLASGG